MGLFKVVSYGTLLSQQKHLKNHFVLKHCDWNDWFKYESLFRLYYVDENNYDSYLGDVKIGFIDTQIDRNDDDDRIVTNLPEDFDRLAKNYFSLGQSRSYYENVYRINDNVFKKLNDVSYNLELFNAVKHTPFMVNSLLRDISTRDVKKQFNRIAHGGAILTEYNFAYNFLKNRELLDCSFNELEFNVIPESTPPSNIHVLIGRNGAGKTHILQSMVKIYTDNDIDNKSNAFFSTKDSFGEVTKITNIKDIFPNLIYSSYSAFDDMEILDFENYSYLGLRKKIVTDSKISYETKNSNELTAEFIKSFNDCSRNYDKRKRLDKALKNLETDTIFSEGQLSTILNNDKLDEIAKEKEGKDELLSKIYTHFSTGHRIILLTITELVNHLTEQSLVLLDEPEMHLHPPLLSAFIRCISELFNDRNAVGIIATHSSIVLQEVPSDCVWIINRVRSDSKIGRPRIETFGTNHTELNEEVFKVEIDNTGFHQMIKDMVYKTSDYQRLEKNFNYHLGNEAETLAHILFYEKEHNED